MDRGSDFHSERDSRPACEVGTMKPLIKRRMTSLENQCLFRQMCRPTCIELAVGFPFVGMTVSIAEGRSDFSASSQGSVQRETHYRGSRNPTRFQRSGALGGRNILL